MKITRRSPFTGIVHEMELDITDEHLARLSTGAPIQQALGHLPPEQREFLISGITPEEWDIFVAGNDR